MFALLVTTGESNIDGKFFAQKASIHGKGEIKSEIYDGYTDGNIQTEEYEEWVETLYTSEKEFCAEYIMESDEGLTTVIEDAKLVLSVDEIL